MPLPEEEYKRQQTWFEQKINTDMNFLNDENKWMKDAQKGCEKEDEKEDEIQPNDGISNVSSPGKTQASSKSKSSLTSSAYLRAKAEKAALIQHLAALKKHALEAQEEKLHFEQERLKRQKEQLEM